MRQWLSVCVCLVAGLVAVGCGGGTTGVSITLSQTTATVPLNGQVQFIPTVSGSSNTVQWSLNGLAVATSTTPSGNTTVGTVDVNGIYTAPSALPASGTTITVTATVQGTSASASASITLNSGVVVSVTPTSYTIGTGEQFQFLATVSGLASDTSLANVCVAFGNPTPNPNNLPLCNAVTWSVTGTNPGVIDPTTGVYSAPSSVASNVTASVTATSVFDTTKATTVNVTISQATDPTITSISPHNAAVGTPFQDVYITGTNFISTTVVYVDGVKIGNSQTQVVSLSSSTTLGVRLLDTSLTTGVHTVTVSQQNGAQQGCTSGATSLCQFTVAAVRPAVVGAPSVPQQFLSGGVDINLDGGYFGTPTSPAVTVKVAGKPENVSVHNGITTPNRDRQLTVTAAAGDMSVPGLYPIEVDSLTSGIPPVIVNVAVQPTAPSPSQLTTLTVGTTPAAVAVSTATGIAVVANQSSSDITLIDMTQSPPATVGFICTGLQGATLTQTETNSCPAAGPTSVAVDDTLNRALVANSGTSTLAVVDLSAKSVLGVVAAPKLNQGAGASEVDLVPASVAVNPTTGAAIVAYRSSTMASILDLNQTPTAPQSQSSSATSPFYKGVVQTNNGLYTRVAVAAKLNWAVITPGAVPGGAGSLAILDLGRQNVNVIAANGATRASGTVTITTTTTHGLQVGEPVLIQGVSDPTFNGYYTVVSVPTSTTFTYTQASTLPNVTSGPGGGTASYASPVTTIGLTNTTVQGVSINDQTQEALLVDPVGGVPVQVLNLLDQVSNSITFPLTLSSEQSNVVAGALSPLVDIGVTVNNTTGNATLINPVTQAPLGTSPFLVGLHPVAVAIDPVTNDAIFVNQGSGGSAGTVSIFNLGTLRAAPEILDVSAAPNSQQPSVTLIGPATVEGAAVTVGSTLTSGVNAGTITAVDQLLTITGGGFSSSSRVRLDGVPLAPPVSATNRQLKVVVPASMQLVPHRYALDVIDSGAVSNASSFTVVQSVDLRTSTCSQPAPQGVAIDDTNNLAVVTNPGCDTASIVDLSTGTARSTAVSAISVGTDPVGVDVLPSAGLAVIANYSSSSATILDEINGSGGSFPATATTDSNPIGVAVDRGSGNALVAANGGNVLDSFAVSSSPGSAATNSVGQGPVGVAVDPLTHLAAVTNSTAGTVSLVDLTGKNSTATVGGLSLPEGVALDPCNSTSNLTGNCTESGFLVAAGTGNVIESITPSTQTATPFRVGVNPTSVAYNFNSSTVVTGNPQSQTMSVVDILDHTVRAVISATPSSLFGVAIHPLTNLAVVVDTTNNQLLLVPLPR